MSPLVFYKSLSEETRLKSLLLIAHKKELCVCDLTDALELSQPKVSRHLAELRKSGLLSDERRGKWVYYQINPSLPIWAKEVLEKTLEENEAYIEADLQRMKACCD